MTRDEHRAKALELHGLADGIEMPAHPERIALLAEAQLHATLAITAPTPLAPARKRAPKKTAETEEPTE